MKPETRFRKSITRNLSSKFKVMQIESGDTAPGVPDTHLLQIGKNRTAWLELKSEKEKPNKIDLRKTQVPWHRKYERAGGKSFIVLKVENINRIYVWRGRFAQELIKGKDIYNLPVRQFTVSKIGWEAFNKYLLDCLRV